jgi:hypothetical protein
MNIFLGQLTTDEKQLLIKWLVILLFLSGIAIFLLPFLLTLPASSKIFDYSNKGGVGDTINGISTPFIAVMGIIVTFLAFYIQVKANELQREINRKQREDIQLERFENKFYELLRLHKENVNEISIQGYKHTIEKRKAFVSMYKEFRYTYFVTKLKYEELRKSNKLKTEYNDIELLKLAYIFFYAGIGIDSDKLNEEMVGEQFDKLLYENVNRELKSIRRQFIEENKRNEDRELNSSLSQFKGESNRSVFRELEINGIGKSRLPQSYTPFAGHMSRLGHYYRHLFQTVKFVTNQKEEFIDKEDKLEYLRTLRAQLSDHEQVMLYYNAMVGFGEAWLTNKYFTDYKMIHNIPIPLADFGITPIVKFAEELKTDRKLFEWLE